MQKIPKKIHFVWVGKNPKPEIVIKCIESWKKFCPDYEINEWNEDNFDIKSNTYASEAYTAKKWAFVADYMRLKILKDNGGIYLDSDLELYRPLDRFLEHSAFTGFESKDYPVTAIMGSTKDHPWINDLLNIYKNKKFILFGQPDMTTNTVMISEIMCSKYGVLKNNKYQKCPHDLHIYPDYYFCRKTHESYAEHHFNNTWKPTTLERYKSELAKIFSYFFNDKKKFKEYVSKKIKNKLEHYKSKIKA